MSRMMFTFALVALLAVNGECNVHWRRLPLLVSRCVIDGQAACTCKPLLSDTQLGLSDTLPT